MECYLHHDRIVTPSVFWDTDDCETTNRLGTDISSSMENDILLSLGIPWYRLSTPDYSSSFRSPWTIDFQTDTELVPVKFKIQT